MKLAFLGTRGEIEARTRRHRMHSSLLVSYRGERVVVDCGEDWLGRWEELNPTAVVVTHAHPDHARGLQDGAPCPVYVSPESRELMKNYRIETMRTVEPRQPFAIGNINFEAFPVEHSTRAPAVGYRISAGRVAIFYAPDVTYVHDRSGAFSGIKLYSGDGATVTRSMIRRQDGALIGHAPVSTQLTWCQKEGVPRAVFTHCGTEVVTDEEAQAEKIEEMGRQRNVWTRVAYDGMELTLR